MFEFYACMQRMIQSSYLASIMVASKKYLILKIFSTVFNFNNSLPQKTVKPFLMRTSVVKKKVFKNTFPGKVAVQKLLCRRPCWPRQGSLLIVYGLKKIPVTP